MIRTLSDRLGLKRVRAADLFRYWSNPEYLPNLGGRVSTRAGTNLVAPTQLRVASFCTAFGTFNSPGQENVWRRAKFKVHYRPCASLNPVLANSGVGCGLPADFESGHFENVIQAFPHTALHLPKARRFLRQLLLGLRLECFGVRAMGRCRFQQVHQLDVCCNGNAITIAVSPCQWPQVDPTAHYLQRPGRRCDRPGRQEAPQGNGRVIDIAYLSCGILKWPEPFNHVSVTEYYLVFKTLQGDISDAFCQ